MPLLPAPDPDAIPLHVVPGDGLEDWLAGRSAAERAWIAAHDFAAGLGETLVLPGPGGRPAAAVIGWGDARARSRDRFHLAAAVGRLPEGRYGLVAATGGLDPRIEALGWLLAQYRFDRYKAVPARAVDLVAPEGVDAARLAVIAAGVALAQDLINTPANELGPEALEAAAGDLARDHGAAFEVLRGPDLLRETLPMIHAVGAAAHEAPRLIDLAWGREDAPRVTLVGKGVCFDTGGLNIKPGSSMGLMKKDMGGAATVIGLARMIMALDLKLRLRVLIPAVENNVAGNAFRPGDILTARDGKTVEINNTDAEGRLVLADALALANETPADLTICMATLTGAARVAVGPDIAPFYTDDDTVAEALSEAARAVADPVWRMPFHAAYETLIEPGIADLDNAPKGGFAGSITAALFLRRFVPDCPRFVHFDIYGWQPTTAPARPKGGVGQGARAILGALSKVLSA